MRVEVQHLEGNKAQIDVTVQEEKVALSIDGAYRKLVKEVTVPGFRKGKAPKKILEARFGVEAFYQDALDILLPQAYEFALDELKLEPIERPEIDVVEFEQGKEAQLRFTVQLPPTVAIGEYKGVSVKEAEASVTDEQIDAEMGKLQERHTRLVDSEDGEVATGDTVNINYAGSVDGVLFDGGSADNQNLEIGSGTFIPGFEEQLVGMKRGDERDITVTFPAEYRNEELAGKEAVFHITLNDIKRKVLPELDDEFAKEVSEYETIGELRAEEQAKLEAAADKARKTRIENAVVAKVVEASTVEVPAVMVEREVDSMLEDLKFNLSRSGLQFDMYLQFAGKTEPELRKEFAPGAENRVKTRLVLDEICKLENISVEESDLDEHLVEMAKPFGQTGEQAREMLEQRGQLDAVRESLATSKTIDYLVGQAVIETE